MLVLFPGQSKLPSLQEDVHSYLLTLEELLQSLLLPDPLCCLELEPSCHSWLRASSETRVLSLPPAWYETSAAKSLYGTPASSEGFYASRIRIHRKTLTRQM